MESRSHESSYAQAGSASHLAGKFLTFALAQEKYGLEILKVQEIIGMLPLTQLPGNRKDLKGIINLRGRSIPVVDLRERFGLAAVPYDSRTCIIVVQLMHQGRHTSVGVIVDTVLEVVNLSGPQLERAPDYGLNLDTNCVLGIGRLQENSVLILIDIERALAGSDLGTTIDHSDEQHASQD